MATSKQIKSTTHIGGDIPSVNNTNKSPTPKNNIDNNNNDVGTPPHQNKTANNKSNPLEHCVTDTIEAMLSPSKNMNSDDNSDEKEVPTPPSSNKSINSQNKTTIIGSGSKRRSTRSRTRSLSSAISSLSGAEDVQNYNTTEAQQPDGNKDKDGVGFPSIAFAKFVQQYMNSTEVCDENNNTVSPIIVSTDTSNISLALTKTNAHANNVGELVITNNSNHSDLESLATLRQRVAIGEDLHTKFDIILGSSLQSLFDETSKQSATLWQSLDVLLSNDNQDAVVILSHVRSGNDQIILPPEPDNFFEVIRRVSGDKFSMYTRDGHSSDFELVLLRRRQV